MFKKFVEHVTLYKVNRIRKRAGGRPISQLSRGVKSEPHGCVITNSLVDLYPDAATPGFGFYVRHGEGHLVRQILSLRYSPIFMLFIAMFDWTSQFQHLVGHYHSEIHTVDKETKAERRARKRSERKTKRANNRENKLELVKEQLKFEHDLEKAKVEVELSIMQERTKQVKIEADRLRLQLELERERTIRSTAEALEKFDETALEVQGT